MGPVGPCMLWTCRSILHMRHSCHHMLGIWVWVCVLPPRLLLHRLLLPPLLRVGAWCVLLKIPQCSGIKSLCLLFTAVAWGCPWLGRAPLPCKIHRSCWLCLSPLLQSWTRAAVCFPSVGHWACRLEPLEPNVVERLDHLCTGMLVYCTHTCILTCMNVCMYVRTYVCMYVCNYMSIFLFVYNYMCI